MTRAFSAEQAREIVRMHRKGSRSAAIAERFGHEEIVRSILRGQSYRDVLHRPDRTCQCCVVGDRQDRNMTAALAAVYDLGPTVLTKFECSLCGHHLHRAAGRVSRAHGTATCAKCNGGNGK